MKYDEKESYKYQLPLIFTSSNCLWVSKIKSSPFVKTQIAYMRKRKNSENSVACLVTSYELFQDLTRNTIWTGTSASCKEKPRFFCPKLRMVGRGGHSKHISFSCHISSFLQLFHFGGGWMGSADQIKRRRKNL